MTGVSISDITALIIEVLNLEDVSAADIDADEALFDAAGLALDSIDALEIGVALQKHYGIRIDSEDAKIRDHFHSVRTLSEFVRLHATKS